MLATAPTLVTTSCQRAEWIGREWKSPNEMAGLPLKHKFVASRDVIVYEKVFSQRDDDPIPHNTPSKGVSQPTPSTALIEGVTEGNTNQTTTNQLHVPECGKDSTPPPSKPDSLAAQPASPIPKPEAASAVVPDPAPSAPRRLECVTQPSWKKEAVEKQKAKEAEVKAERKTRRETCNQSKLSQEPESMPLKPTTMGNIAQTAYLAAHGHEIPQNF